MVEEGMYLKDKRKKVGQETIDQIHSLRALGQSYREITSQLSISTTTVRRHVDPGFVQRKYKGEKKRRRSQVYTIVNGKRGRYTVNNRRPRPEACELCGSVSRRLAWHHWNENNLELGMWLCGRCHPGVHLIDDGLGEKYSQLKAQAGADGK